MYSCMYSRGVQGVLLPPPLLGIDLPPYKMAFPTFNMGLLPLGFVFAICPPPLEFWHYAFAPSRVKS